MSDKKIAIITGTSSGVGLATSQTFLANGWNVLGVDISPPPESLTSNTTSFSFLKADITKPDAPSEIVSAAKNAFGSPKIDALLNVAGIMDKFAAVDNMLDADWDRVIAINLTAPVKLMREVINVMKANGGGSIVNVCSKAATSGAASGAAYTASKHGLLGITRNTAWMFKDDGIRCNAIAPGGVATNITQSTPQETWDMASFMKIKPVHEIHFDYAKDIENAPGCIQPSAQAAVLFFLASDASVGVNGVLVPVDSAWSTL
ncbi:NAD(P)-binding protein [Marasmius fiardii PR-910]|nr:NAD(P)-binding protein [Marasmius fiardii PR-910]